MSARFQLGVVFSDCVYATDSLRNRFFLLGSLRARSGKALGCFPSLDDAFEGFFLMFGEGLDGLNEIGDEVPAAAQLDINGGEGIAHGITAADEAIVSCGDYE